MKHLYRQLTWSEARERAAAGSVITVPVAAIEQHGYHLPVDVDNVLVEHVTEEAALAPPPGQHQRYHNPVWPGVFPRVLGRLADDPQTRQRVEQRRDHRGTAPASTDRHAGPFSGTSPGGLRSRAERSRFRPSKPCC